MSEALLTAIAIGFSSGFIPGPLSVAVIQQTLQGGVWRGIKVSLIPIVTDGPIILFSLWMLAYFRSSEPVIAFISLAGGLYLLRLGFKMLLLAPPSSDAPSAQPLGFGEIVKINLLNPNPYLFWTTVGGAYIVTRDSGESFVFILALLFSVIGAKAVQAVAASVFRGRGPQSVQRWANKGFGLILAIFAAIYIKNAYIMALS